MFDYQGWQIKLTGIWFLLGLVLGIVFAVFMVKRRPYGTSFLWYFVYIVVNVLTLGSIWFFRNLITYAVRLGQKDH